jgi:hypothetical protein
MKAYKVVLVIGAAAICGYAVSAFRDSQGSMISNPRRLTPEGEFCLLVRASIQTPSGVTGYAPGTRVQLVEDRGDTMIVEVPPTQFEVRSDSLTNDIELAEMAARSDSKSQEAVQRLIAKIKTDAALQEGARAKPQTQPQRRGGSALVSATSSNPLDRGSYDRKNNVTRAPRVTYHYLHEEARREPVRPVIVPR